MSEKTSSSIVELIAVPGSGAVNDAISLGVCRDKTITAFSRITIVEKDA
jgi:hypothetical protein